jgi:hypothetical protein
MDQPMMNPNRQGQPGAAGIRTARRSGMAIAAFILALVPCCPVVSALGSTLGLVAYRRIRTSGGMLRGEKLAKAAIFCGLAISLLSLIGFTSLQSGIQRGLKDGIVQCIEQFISKAQQAAQTGDVTAARERWVISATRPGDDAIAAFGRESQARYGAFQRFTITSFTSNATYSAQQEVAGVFIFENKQLVGSGRLVLPPQWNVLKPRLLLMEIKVEDPDAGDLALR